MNASLTNLVLRFFMTPPRETGHGNSESVMWQIVVTLSAFGLWLLRFYRERTERELWAALRQQKLEAESREQLLRLLFQIVVRVRGEQIKVTDDFEAMFGANV